MLRDEDLAALEESEKKATPGPWKVGSDSRDHLIDANIGIDGDPAELPILTSSFFGASAFPHNAEFIILSRRVVPELIAEAKRLRSQVAALENFIEMLRCGLARYGRHDSHCPAFVEDVGVNVSNTTGRTKPSYACMCGFDESVKRKPA